MKRIVLYLGRRDFKAVDLMNIICESEDKGEKWSDEEDTQIEYHNSVSKELGNGN